MVLGSASCCVHKSARFFMVKGFKEHSTNIFALVVKVRSVMASAVVCAFGMNGPDIRRNIGPLKCQRAPLLELLDRDVSYLIA